MKLTLKIASSGTLGCRHHQYVVQGTMHCTLWHGLSENLKKLFAAAVFISNFAAMVIVISQRLKLG